ncbi:MAG: hypothetical protein U1F48_09950 [Burkholderiales bacterium]
MPHLPRIPERWQPWAGLALAVVLAGLASIGLRQDSSWDLQNYHLYNAWAFVHGRFGLDWAPAQLQSFYSPYLDLPFYALFAADAPPRLIAFALAIPTGIAWYCFARIVQVLFAHEAQPLRTRAALAAFALGVTAPMPISLIGTTMNDWYVAACVVGALWLVVRKGDPAAASTRTWLVAGALVGAAAGLKLTGSIYAVGLGVAVLSLGRWRAVLAAGLAMSAAFALTAGPWLATMAARYGNPLFPYFNDVFRSPWADPVSFSATRFGPQTAVEWLVFPYLLLVKLEGYVAEPEFRDARLALLYTLVLAALALVAVRRARGGAPPPASPARPAWRFLAVFAVASFVAWALVYRIARYLVPLELLAGAFTAALVVRLVPARRATLALAAALALVVVTAKFPTWWRQPFGEHFLAVDLPPVKADALVLLVSAEPMSYVLPAFPADARFAGLVSNFNDPGRHNRLQETIARTIAGHRGALYSLAVPPGRGEGAAALARMGLRQVQCAVVRTNLRVSPLELCELARSAPP